MHRFSWKTKIIHVYAWLLTSVHKTYNLLGYFWYLPVEDSGIKILQCGNAVISLLDAEYFSICSFLSIWKFHYNDWNFNKNISRPYITSSRCAEQGPGRYPPTDKNERISISDKSLYKKFFTFEGVEKFKRKIIIF